MQDLIAELETQEERLQFDRFDNDDAWTLGSLLVTTARERGLGITVDVRRGGQQLFHAALPGTAPDNDRWIERKVRVVERLHNSSYLVGRRLAAKGATFDESYGVAPADYATHGGAFPIRVRNVGVVGVITVSGLPQAEDHAFVVEMLQRYLGQLS